MAKSVDVSSTDAAFTFTVDEEAAGLRLDQFLAREFLDQYSRERLQTVIEAGRVTVDDRVLTKASSRLKEAQRVAVSMPQAVPLVLTPEAIDLDIVFEDADLIVVNKPAGMLTHPTGREQTGTLVNALLAHCGDQLSGINGVIRPGIVHRLDRDTEGLLMVAKTDQAHRHLSRQLQAKTARREYRAILQGLPKAESGRCSHPIGRNPKQRDQMMVSPDGRPAVTHWRVVDRIQDKFVLAHLRLETGRTHQIRVHMAQMGHPVLNDPVYGTGLGKLLKLEERLGARGQLLQAFRLGLRHPVSDTPLQFEIDCAPRLQRVWADLQNTG